MPTYGDETGSFGRTAQQGMFEGLGDALGGGNPFKNDYRNIGAGDFSYNGKNEDYFAQLAKQRRGYYGAVAGQALGRGGQAWGDFQSSPDTKAALAALADASQGKTPSVAEQMMGRGLQQNQMQQMSAAAGARGGPGAWAAAQRGAAANMVNAGQDIIGQQGMVRAQEMAHARDAYSQAAMQKRMQDLQASGMSYDQALQASGLGDKASAGYLGLGQNAAGQEMQGRQNYAQWITAQATGKEQHNQQAAGAGLAAIGSLASAASDVRVKKDIATEGPSGHRPMTGAAWDDPHTRELASPYARLKPDDEDATDWKGVGGYLRALASSVGTMSDIKMKKDIKVEGPEQSFWEKRAEESVKSPLHKVQRALEPGWGEGALMALAKAGSKDAPVILEALNGQPAAQQLVSYADQDRNRAVAGGQRVKPAAKTTAPIAKATPAVRMLEEITPASFTYKADPTGQRRFGVMAQDLERSPMGASLVHDTQGGKMVDAAQGTMAALHALADMHQRVKRLEGTTKQEKR